MTFHIFNAERLLQIGRHKEAEEQLRRALAENPNDAYAHSLLAIVLTVQGNGMEAEQEARKGIELAPTDSYSYYAMALIFNDNNKLDSALNAIREAIRLEPMDPRYYKTLGQIHIGLRQWQEALTAIDEGLRIDPENVDCANLRAIVLVQLGRRREAAETLEGALGRDPDNAKSHANMGWAMLHRSQPLKAMEHFREALRLNPNDEWAQAGIIEAMKARNPIYRIMLGYFLYMGRMETRTQFAILIGGWFVIQVSRNMLGDSPLVIPLVAVYFLFAFLSWTAQPLFDLTLRTSKFGRMALPPDKIVASNWVGLCVLGAIGLASAGIMSDGNYREMLLIAAAESLALVLPVSGIFQAKPGGNAFYYLIVYTLILVTIAGLDLLISLSSGGTPSLWPLFLLGWIGYSWVGNILLAMDRRSQ